MARIKVIGMDEAKGVLKQQYDDAISRAGKIYNIVSIMSQNPQAMESSMEFYKVLMFGPSPLSRGRREMLATLVSSVNQCVY